MNRISRTNLLAVCLLMGSILMLNGCGGGASAVPTVTVKPATEFNPGGGGDEVDGTGTKDPKVPPPEAGGTGTLKGVFAYDGPAVTRASIASGVKADQVDICVADKILSERLIVNDGKLQNVFIYLKRAPKGAKTIPPPETPYLFDQKACVFLTHAGIVRVGQQLLVKNSDPIDHNTNSGGGKNPGFNFAVAGGGEKELAFDLGESKPFLVKCDVHTWMTAYLHVMDHGFGAVSAADGTFTIADLPVGKHRFDIWHEGNYLKQNHVIEIKPGDNPPVEIKFVADEFK